MIKIELLKLDKQQKKLSFILKNANAAFANAIRRNAIEEVPVMAIDDVEFRNNSSVLYDEIIAHRLGLITLTTDLKSYNLPDKCKCNGKGCAQCQLKLKLKAMSQGVVYASEIKSTDPNIKPVYPKTPIVKMLKGQKIEFEATAILGKGKDHTKWCPGLVYYKNMPIININKNCENPDAVVEQCPQSVFEVKNNKLVLNKDNLLKCHLCNACVDICEPKGAITVDKNEKEFIFYVESWGQLEPNEIIDEALNIIRDTSNEFIKEIKDKPAKKKTSKK
ncbi:DNA-directed RNA polymerase subunit D [Candidatus Woesearchaeota archaeon CG06_land_8_20_14_3_00_33_13]|nr:MAG: DNA-directed RNA polymerase subunit D [Candidatus Woesearchaeota archaeon CG10_big_fil_rev_8_21_14_0_10_33_12]PIU72642.1 MAG: DNA-directed RNA polymerase subunit D [Candidatus Woesearchaeota archaeon CG06_land_8_20_14_3_00_33_13]